MKKPKSFSIPRKSGSSVFRLPKLYDLPEWKEYSVRFLLHNPKCYCCGNKSQATDHWEAHKNKLELFWKEENMMPLCFKCHNTVTSNFDKFNPPLTSEKLQFINASRLSKGLEFRVKIVPIKLKRK